MKRSDKRLKELKKRKRQIKKLRNKWHPTLSGFATVLITVVVVLFIFLLPFWIIPWAVPKVMDDQVNATSLLLSAWSLEVTIGIAFLIYFLQKRDNKKQHDEDVKAAEEAYKRIAKSTVDYLLTVPRNRDPATIASNRDQFLKFYNCIDEVMLESDRIWLDQLIAKADSGGRSGYESDIFRDWLKVFVQSDYGWMTGKVSEPYDLLDRRTYHLLQDLRIDGTEEPFRDCVDVFFDSDGTKLFEKTDSITELRPKEMLCFEAIETIEKYKNERTVPIPKLPEGKNFTIINVYRDDEVIFSGTFGRGASIHTGYEKSREYQGYYKNGHYEGIGLFWDQRYDGKTWLKSEEGYFCNGILKYGIKYGFPAIWQKGEFAKEKDGCENEYLLAGFLYDYKGGKLKEGTFTRNHGHETISGIEYNWVVKLISGKLIYNKEAKDFDGDNNTELEDYIQYYSDDGSKINFHFDFLESEIEHEGFDKFYIADIEIKNNQYRYVNIRKLDKFMMKEDPEQYKRIKDMLEK